MLFAPLLGFRRSATARAPTGSGRLGLTRRAPASAKPCTERLEERNLLSSSIPLSTTSWTPIGPAPIATAQVATYPHVGDALPVTGRISGVAADPTDPHTIYIAASGGGVWKTTDGGTTWSARTDNQAVLFMGAIAIAPSNPRVIYAGTGAEYSDDNFYGRGVLKSTDAGATWTLLTGNAGVNEFDRQSITKILVDPTNASTVYVISNDLGRNGAVGTNGIYRSTDGGTTWTNTTTSISTDPLVSFTDAVLDPSNPETLYAAVGTFNGNAANGVYKSTDGGASWSRAGNCPMGTGDGIIGIAIAPSAPQTLFAVINDPRTFGFLEMLKSTDGGNTWNVLPKVPSYESVAGSLAVDPANASIVYAGGLSFIESTDGGNTWKDISSGVDHHSIAFDANGKLLDAYDQGLERLDNPDPSNLQWAKLNGNLQITTFTGIALDPTNPDIAYGGSQDAGTAKFTGTLGWTAIRVGDGGFVRVDQTNPSTVYHTYQYGIGNNFFQRSDDYGMTWKNVVNGINLKDPANFYVPYVMDPSDSSRLALGTDRVYETTDQGAHWNPLSAPNANGWNSSQRISALGMPSGDPNTLYAATDDAHLFVTTDHGRSWQQRDIPGISSQSAPPSPPPWQHYPFEEISVDPANKASAYVVVDAFTGGKGGHVFHTSDFGQHWTDISGNLPDTPTSTIVLDSRTDVLYVGTDIGVFASKNRGASWSTFATGLPNARVVDLELSPALNILAAGTHGRGMWEISVPTGASSGALVAGLSSGQVGVPTLASAIPSAAAGQGVRTIADVQPRIGISHVTKREGKKGAKTFFTFTVTLSAAYYQAVKMSFQTTDGTAKTSDSDYAARTGTLTFAPGETTKTITIVVNGDSKREADETFYLDLFGNSSNSWFTKNRGLGTILNDD